MKELELSLMKRRSTACLEENVHESCMVSLAQDLGPLSAELLLMHLLRRLSDGRYIKVNGKSTGPQQKSQGPASKCPRNAPTRKKSLKRVCHSL